MSEFTPVLLPNQVAKLHSQVLMEISYETENDGRAWDLDRHAHRQKKVERFENGILKKIASVIGEQNILWEDKKQSYKLTLIKDGSPLIVDYFPKANRLLVRKENKWFNRGDRWLQNFILGNGNVEEKKWNKSNQIL